MNEFEGPGANTIILALTVIVGIDFIFNGTSILGIAFDARKRAST